MMDKYYLLATIDRLKNEIKVHDQKFQNNPVHNNCLPRMEKTLSSLQEELTKVESTETLHEKHEAKRAQ
jgi:uncharacterized coiled-coil DUF342 family protein